MGMKRLGALLVSLLIAAVPASAQQTPTNATVSTVDKAQRVVCVNPTSHALESCAGSGGGGGGTVDQGAPATTSDAAAWPMKVVFGSAQIDPRAIRTLTISDQVTAILSSGSAVIHVIVDNAPTNAVTQSGVWSMRLQDGAGNTISSTASGLWNVIRDAAGNARGANVNASSQLSVSVDNIPHVVVDTAPTTAVTGPLTDTQLRATAVPVSGSVTTVQPTGSNLHVVVDTAPTTAVTGPLTDTQLRATAVPVSGTVAVSSVGGTVTVNGSGVTQPVSGTVTATQGTATSLKAQAEAYQGGTAVGTSNPLQVSLANTGANATAVKVDGSGVTQPVSGSVGVSGSVAVTGPLTDTQLRATPVPVSGTVAVSSVGGTVTVNGSGVTQPVSGTVTATQSTGTNLHVVVDAAPTTAVTGPLTDTQLRASRVPVDGSGVTQPVSGTVGVSGSVAVTGPLTDTQLRATAVPVSGTFYQVTQPVSGTVTVQQATASNLNVTTVPAGTTTVSGTISMLGDAVATNSDVFQSYAGVIADLSGVWTGDIGFFCNQGAGFKAITAIQLNLGVSVGDTVDPGLYYLPACRQVEVLAEGWTGGTANITLSTTAGVMLGNHVLDQIRDNQVNGLQSAIPAGLNGLALDTGAGNASTVNTLRTVIASDQTALTVEASDSGLLVNPIKPQALSLKCNALRKKNCQ